MTVQSSHFVVDPVGGTASHGMTYDGNTIPDVSFSAGTSTVSVQGRPLITTSIAGLKFFLAESRYWSSLVEGRIPDGSRPRQPIAITNNLAFVTTGDSNRIDDVVVVADIASIPVNATHIDLAWQRTTGAVTLGPRIAAQMRWNDWLDFLAVHEQFISLIETGRR